MLNLDSIYGGDRNCNYYKSSVVLTHEQQRQRHFLAPKHRNSLNTEADSKWPFFCLMPA